MRLLMLLSITLAGWSFSCASTDDATITGDGTVRFQEIEGGCWSIVAADSAVYEPLHLAEEFRQDGLKVTFVARPRPEMASVCMVGRIVEIISIRRR
jgi:hypothetical protein